MHLDIDAFFASVEQVRNPHLRGKPVVVGNGVVASCSYEARKRGLSAGMQLTAARRICPDAVILDGHYPTYKCFAEKVFDVCRGFSPNIETYLDEAYCELTGTELLHGPPLEVGRRVKEKIRETTGLSVTIGLGANRMVCKLAGKLVKPDGLAIVEEGTEESFVSRLPIDYLPGVGASIGETLRKLNIQTIGDLRALSADEVEMLFGAVGLALYERCRGRDSRAINEREIPVSISRETAFHHPTIDLKEIKGMLYYLIERATKTMRGLGIESKTLSVRIRYMDGEGKATRRTLPASTDMEDELFERALLMLKSIYTKRASLHFIGVALSNFSMRGGEQPELFDAERKARLGRLHRALDGMRDKLGYSSIVVGPSICLLDKLKRDSYGYVLRTPSLTK